MEQIDSLSSTVLSDLLDYMKNLGDEKVIIIEVFDNLLTDYFESEFQKTVIFGFGLILSDHIFWKHGINAQIGDQFVEFGQKEWLGCQANGMNSHSSQTLAQKD